MNIWYIWLILAVAFVVVECMTLELVSVWFTVSALVTMILSFLKVELWIQVVVFGVLSAILICATRPFLVRYLKRNESKTNIDTIIGMVATVTKEIKENDRGEVKLGGQYWLAIAADNSSIEVDTEVTVLAIEGAKLVVKPINK